MVIINNSYVCFVYLRYKKGTRKIKGFSKTGTLNFSNVIS